MGAIMTPCSGHDARIQATSGSAHNNCQALSTAENEEQSCADETFRTACRRPDTWACHALLDGRDRLQPIAAPARDRHRPAHPIVKPAALRIVAANQALWSERTAAPAGSWPGIAQADTAIIAPAGGDYNGRGA
jgi:hypothetical protein